jgi:hypothetical protein
VLPLVPFLFTCFTSCQGTGFCRARNVLSVAEITPSWITDFTVPRRLFNVNGLRAKPASLRAPTRLTACGSSYPLASITGSRGAKLAGTNHILQGAFICTTRWGLAQSQSGIAQNSNQQVIEVVSDSARQYTDALQPRPL